MKARDAGTTGDRQAMRPAARRSESMTEAEIRAEFRALRRHLDQLSETPDDALTTTRYALRRQPWPHGMYFKARRLAADLLELLDALPMRRGRAWRASLRHASPGRNAKPLLVWGIGIDRPTLRRACEALAAHSGLDGFAPVLVTDVADFAFFSRLGWLVELVPPLDGEGESYTLRKSRHLARRYRGAPAMPARVCLELGRNDEAIRRCLTST